MKKTKVKVYSKLIRNEHFESEVKIKSFLFDDNYRKFVMLRNKIILEEINL